MATLNVIYKVAADITGLKDGVDKAVSTMEQLQATAEKVAGAFGVGLGAKELVEFAHGAIEAADSINNLSAATGVARADLQRMAYVGVGFGLSMEDLGRAVEQFSQRLANGDTSAVKAVNMLGLSVRDLIASGPTEAFLALTEAAGRIEDPMLRGGVAADAFGERIARVLLPALGELRQRMNDVPKSAIIGDENIKLAAEFDESLGHLSIRLKALAVDFLSMPSNIIDFWQGMLASNDALTASLKQSGIQMAVSHDQTIRMAVSHQQAAAAATEHLTATDLLQNRLTALRDQALVPLSAAVMDNIVELSKMGVSEQEIAQLTNTNVVAVHQFVDAHRIATEEAKRFATAAENIAGVMSGPAGVNQGIKDQVNLLLQLGASQSDIAIKFGISQGAVASLAKELQRTTAEMKSLLETTNSFVVANLNAQAALAARQGFGLSGRPLTDSSPAGQMQQSQRDYQQQLDDLHRNAPSGVDISAIEEKLFQDFQDSFAKAAEAAGHVADAHQGAADAASAVSAQFANAGQASVGLVGAFNQSVQSFIGMMIPTAASLRALALEPGSMLGLGIPGIGPTGVSLSGLARLPHRAAGGSVGSGLPYMVGERGPEMFVPGSDGMVFPNGKTGGQTSVTVNVSGLMMSTDPRARAQVAAMVDDAVRSALDRTGRKRGTV